MSAVSDSRMVQSVRAQQHVSGLATHVTFERHHTEVRQHAGNAPPLRDRFQLFPTLL